MGWLNRLGSAARSSSPRANFRLIHASAQRSICCRSWSGTLARTHSWVRRRRARRVVAERRGCTSVDVCGRYESSRRFQPFQPDQLRLSLVLVRFAPEAACAPMLRSSSLVMHRWILASSAGRSRCCRRALCKRKTGFILQGGAPDTNQTGWAPAVIKRHRRSLYDRGDRSLRDKCCFNVTDASGY